MKHSKSISCAAWLAGNLEMGCRIPSTALQRGGFPSPLSSVSLCFVLFGLSGRYCSCQSLHEGFSRRARAAPLADVTPAAINARVVKHAGHTGLLVSLHPPCELHVRIYKPRIVISIVMSQPFHAISESSFVAAFRNDVQQVIGGDEHIETASE